MNEYNKVKAMDLLVINMNESLRIIMTQILSGCKKGDEETKIMQK